MPYNTIITSITTIWKRLTTSLRSTGPNLLYEKGVCDCGIYPCVYPTCVQTNRQAKHKCAECIWNGEEIYDYCDACLGYDENPYSTIEEGLIKSSYF